MSIKPYRVLGFVLALLLAAPELMAASIFERPVPEGGGPTAVYCALAILDLDNISDADQNFTLNLFTLCRWSDPREAHDGTGNIAKNLDEVWHPHLVFLNRQKVWSARPDVVVISPVGEVSHRQNLWGDFSQPMDLRAFPLDTQTFKIQLIPAGSEEFGEITLFQDPVFSSFIVEEYSVADWEILENEVSTEPRILPTGEYVAAFALAFTARRLSNHYLIKLIAPLLMILALSWMVFWLDPTEGAAQLGVAVTTCLTVIAFHLALGSNLPKIPYLTHLDVFIFGATLLVFLAMIEVVTTTGLARTGRVSTARWLDRISRLVFPALLAGIGMYAFVWR